MPILTAAVTQCRLQTLTAWACAQPLVVPCLAAGCLLSGSLEVFDCVLSGNVDDVDLEALSQLQGLPELHTFRLQLRLSYPHYHHWYTVAGVAQLATLVRAPGLRELHLGIGNAPFATASQTCRLLAAGAAASRLQVCRRRAMLHVRTGPCPGPRPWLR